MSDGTRMERVTRFLGGSCSNTFSRESRGLFAFAGDSGDSGDSPLNGAGVSDTGSTLGMPFKLAGGPPLVDCCTGWGVPARMNSIAPGGKSAVLSAWLKGRLSVMG